MLGRKRIGFKEVVLSFFLMIFISSLIIFDLESNVAYSNFINVSFWGVFVIIYIFDNRVKLHKNPIFSRYLFFAIYAFLTIFWAYDVNLVLNYSLRLIVITINIYILFILLHEYDLKHAFLIGIIIGAIYNYLLAFNIITPNFEIFEFGRFLGSVGNPNKLSKIMLLSVFASSMLLVMKERKLIVKLLLILNVILALYVIFLTASKQAIILAPLFILFSFKLNGLKIRNLTFYICFFLLLFYITLDFLPMDEIFSNYDRIVYRLEKFIDTLSGVDSGASTRERKELVIQGLNLFYDHPVFGVGMNNFRLFFGKYAHNNYLELLVGVGLIGAIIFYSLYYIIIKKINGMVSSKAKKLFYTMIFVLLIMDLVTVTYLDKMVIFTLLFIYTFTLNHQKKSI